MPEGGVLVMGGHALHVWAAYAVAAAAFGGLALWSRAVLRRRRREAAELEARRPGRRGG